MDLWLCHCSKVHNLCDSGRRCIVRSIVLDAGSLYGTAIGLGQRHTCMPHQKSKIDRLWDSTAPNKGQAKTRSTPSESGNSGDLSIPADGHKWRNPSKASATLLSPTQHACLEISMFPVSTQASDGNARKANCHLFVVLPIDVEMCGVSEILVRHL